MQKVLVSACLLGEAVRYNGADKRCDHEILQRWISEGRVVPVCPEIAGGLGVPRPASEIAGGAGGAQVLAGAARVIDANGHDVSSQFIEGARVALASARANGIRLAILKEGSPSCGTSFTADGTFSGRKVRDLGVTSALLLQNGIEVFSENQLEEAGMVLAKLEARRSGRPEDGEFAAYAKKDIDAVPGDDAVEALISQATEVEGMISRMSDDAVRGVAYAPGKWTIKQVIGHMIDDERIFAYRILCLARNDRRELPGFDENEYMAGSNFESQSLNHLLSEYRSVRGATVSLLESFGPEAWQSRGTVNGYQASVRGLAFHVAGHELHHLRLLRERYLPLLK